MIIFGRIMLLSRAITLVVFGGLAAPAVGTDNIAGYYLLLPPGIYQHVDMGPTLSLESRKEMIAMAKAKDPRIEGAILLDVPNGYLGVLGSDSGERHDLTMALFRQKDRSALIALTADENFEQEAENGGGPATHFFGFYIIEKNAWIDVTRRVAPQWPLPDAYVVLPRYGTTIKIYSRGRGELIAVWQRQGDGFIEKELE